jgi:hypothetical protein
MKIKMILAIVLALVAGGALAAESAGFTGWVETIHNADKNGDGMLTPTEVMYYNPSAHEAGFRPFMVNHFADWDFDNDGMVSMDEIHRGMEQANMTDKDMDKAFFESVGFQPMRSH